LSSWPDQDPQAKLRQEVLTAIEEIGRRRLHVDGAVDPTAHLVRDLGLDSLKQLSLLIEIEDRFCVAFDDLTDQRIETVQDLVDAVVTRVSTREDETTA